MGDRLKGKVAIVTGSGRGIGRGVALALASEGAKVVINDLGGAVDGTGAAKGPADEVVAEIKANGGEAVANYEDVSDYQAAERIIQSAIDNFGKLDILVNIAGILRDRMIFNMSEDEWDRVLKVHLYGTFNTTRFASVLMRQQRSGRIVNTSSSSGLGSAGQPNYGAAKEGIVGLTRSVARAMGKYGVTCNAIRPGAATRMTMSDELKAAWEKQQKAGATMGPATAGGQEIQMDQLGAMRPEDIGPFIVWLCSDDAANVNGYDFAVQSGQIGLDSQPTIVNSIKKDGPWTVDDMFKLMPSIASGLENPAPPKE